jgi:NTP pyrophosphatase (non-canonical NTP hydrolase)
MVSEIERLSDELHRELNKRLPDVSLSSKVVKVLEELGEVADLVLRKEGIHRKSKKMPNEEINKELAKEICDTIIPLILMARSGHRHFH